MSVAELKEMDLGMTYNELWIGDGVCAPWRMAKENDGEDESRRQIAFVKVV